MQFHAGSSSSTWPEDHISLATIWPWQFS